MSFLTHKVPVWPFLHVIWQVKVFRHKLPKDNPLAGSKAKAAQAWQTHDPLPKISDRYISGTSARSLLFLPPCTGLEHHTAHPLPARAFDHPGQCPCLKHWSSTGAVQQTASSVLGEVVTHFPSQHASVPSLPHLWHTDTSTYTIKGPS